MPVSVMVAVNATGPETGLQSRWYRQHRIPYAPDPPEPDGTPVSPCSNQVRVQFHLVQRQRSAALASVARSSSDTSRSSRVRGEPGAWTTRDDRTGKVFAQAGGSSWVIRRHR